MNTIEEKQIDELAAYKGKWACMWVFPSACAVGSLRFESEKEVRPLVLFNPTGEYITLEKAQEINLKWKKDMRFTFRDVACWFPIPVKS